MKKIVSSLLQMSPLNYFQNQGKFTCFSFFMVMNKSAHFEEIQESMIVKSCPEIVLLSK